jgi:hypothetical protein
LASQFHEGLKADVQKSIDLLPSSMPLVDLLERAVEVEVRLQVTPSWATLVATVVGAQGNDNEG